MEIDSALTAIQTLRSELQDAKLAAVNTQLKPLPGESVRGAFDLWLTDSGFILSKPNLEKWQFHWIHSSYANNIDDKLLTPEAGVCWVCYLHMKLLFSSDILSALVGEVRAGSGQHL